MCEALYPDSVLPSKMSFILVLGVEPRAWHILGKHWTSELYQSLSKCLSSPMLWLHLPYLYSLGMGLSLGIALKVEFLYRVCLGVAKGRPFPRGAVCVQQPRRPCHRAVSSQQDRTGLRLKS